MTLLIRNGKIVTPYGSYDADVRCEDGMIRSIDRSGTTAGIDEVIDATGMLVYPGFIDPHVHSRDPGLTYKEDFRTTTRSAAAGGVTTVFDMPNVIPPLCDAETFQARAATHGRVAFVDFGLWGLALGVENIEEVPRLFEAGIVALKLFWGYALNRATKQLAYNFTDEQLDDLILPPDNGQLLELFRAVASTGGILAAHCEDRSILEASQRALGREVRTYQDLLSTRPAVAENTSIAIGGELAAATGCRFHVLHLASGRGAEIIRRRRSEGVAISAESCPQYLTLTDQSYASVRGLLKFYPPVRTDQDRSKLMDAVNDGTICSIGSDHAPHSEEEKRLAIAVQPAGYIGVETLVRIMLNEVAEGQLAPERLAWVLSEGTARLYGLYPRKGALLPGSDADVTVVEPEAPWRIRNEDLHAKNAVSPWNGKRGRGRPHAVVLRGEVVMRDGELIGEARGRLVRPNRAGDRCRLMAALERSHSQGAIGWP